MGFYNFYEFSLINSRSLLLIYKNMSTSSTTSTPPLSLSFPLAKREREEVVVIVIDDDDSAAANQLKRPCFAPGEVIVIDDDDDGNCNSNSNNSNNINSNRDSDRDSDNIRKAKAKANVDPSLTIEEQFYTLSNVRNCRIPDRFIFGQFPSSDPWHPGHVANDYRSKHRRVSLMMSGVDLTGAREWVNLHWLANIACYDPSFCYFLRFVSVMPVDFALRLRYLNERYDPEVILFELYFHARRITNAGRCPDIFQWQVPIAFRVEMVRCYMRPDSKLAYWLDFVFGCYEIVTPAFVMETIEVFEQLRPGATDSESIALALRDQPHRDSEVLRCFRRYPLRRVLQQLPWWPIFRQDPDERIGIFRSSFGLDTNVLLLIASFLDTVESGRVV